MVRSYQPGAAVAGMRSRDVGAWEARSVTRMEPVRDGAEARAGAAFAAVGLSKPPSSRALRRLTTGVAGAALDVVRLIQWRVMTSPGWYTRCRYCPEQQVNATSAR